MLGKNYKINVVVILLWPNRIISSKLVFLTFKVKLVFELHSCFRLRFFCFVFLTFTKIESKRKRHFGFSLQSLKLVWTWRIKFQNYSTSQSRPSFTISSKLNYMNNDNSYFRVFNQIGTFFCFRSISPNWICEFTP